MQQSPPLLYKGVRIWNLVSRWSRRAAGAFVFCTREGFQAVNGFDVSLFAGEEIGFSRRPERYARRRGQRLVILGRHPLHTSGRKGKLYSRKEILLLGFRILRQPRRFSGLKTEILFAPVSPGCKRC